MEGKLTVKIYWHYRKKLKKLVLEEDSTIEELFPEALEILLERYESILDGTETQFQMPLIGSTIGINMNLPVTKKILKI